MDEKPEKVNKKAPDMQKALDEINASLLGSKKYHEVETVILQNHNLRVELEKKVLEVKQLKNQVRDYYLTRIMAWLGAISGSVLLIFQLIEWYNKFQK